MKAEGIIAISIMWFIVGYVVGEVAGRQSARRKRREIRARRLSEEKG